MSAPYLIIGFDVDPSDPDGDDIIADIRATFPLVTVPISLGVENLVAIEVAPSQMIHRLNQLSNFFSEKDTEHGDKLRWVVQLCRSAEVSIG